MFMACPGVVVHDRDLVVGLSISAGMKKNIAGKGLLHLEYSDFLYDKIIGEMVLGRPLTFVFVADNGLPWQQNKNI